MWVLTNTNSRPSTHSIRSSTIQRTSSEEDFVSQDVSDALQEAREIATEGKARDNPRERLRSDTTTVKVMKGGRNDPMEVIVSRSRVVSQSDTECDDAEEECASGEDECWGQFGSYSDSEFPPRSMSLHKHSLPPHLMRDGRSESELLEAVSSGFGPPTLNSIQIIQVLNANAAYQSSHQHTIKPQTRHTNVRYRRKHHDSFWRKDETADDEAEGCGGVGGDEADDEMGLDEAKLEIDVKEEECTTDEGAHLVIKTWEARWTVQNYELLPEWLQDNEFLMTGHRPPLPSFSACFKSIWSLHTETGNIWTHLIGKWLWMALIIQLI